MVKQLRNLAAGAFFVALLFQTPVNAYCGELIGNENNCGCGGWFTINMPGASCDIDVDECAAWVCSNVCGWYYGYSGLSQCEDNQYSAWRGFKCGFVLGCNN